MSILTSTRKGLGEHHAPTIHPFKPEGNDIQSVYLYEGNINKYVIIQMSLLHNGDIIVN